MFTSAFLTLASLAALASAQTPRVANPVNLKVGLNSNFCLAASGTTNGAAVDITPCAPGAVDQAWTFAGGQVQIYGNKCLDVMYVFLFQL